MSNRLDQEREKRLQPKRIDTALKELEKLGVKIIYQDETTLRFIHDNHTITFYPYSGWHTGKSIKDGRGLKKLLRQLK